MLPSASLNESQFGVYEPVHGSAPDIAGKGIANPVGMLSSCALALRHSLGLEDEASALEQAVEATLKAGARTTDLSSENPLSTEAFADKVLEALRRTSPVLKV